MLKIQRKEDGGAVFTVAGRLEPDTVGELFALLALEPAERALVLDLKDLVLVDREAVRFLRACEGRGILLRNCPPYIRVWMACDSEQS
jgi:hypothetical protein